MVNHTSAITTKEHHNFQTGLQAVEIDRRVSILPKHQILVAANICNGKFVLHSELEHSGRSPNSFECFKRSDCPSFVLPQWLHLTPVRGV
ncbi:unnamed protein product [Arabidopsis halleri]